MTTWLRKGRHWLAWLGLWLCASVALGQGLQPVPELRARMMDQTGTLDAASLSAIEARLAAFEQAKGSQVVVLMVATTAPEDIADFTQRLGDAWKIGRPKVGDGVLLVIAKDDRRLRIATAKALEGAIPDLVASRIIERAITPAFRQQDYSGGIQAGLEHILARISGEDLPLPGNAPQAGGDFEPTDLLIFAVFVVPLVSNVLRGLFGNKLGALLTGAAAGGMAWWLTSVGWIAIGVGLLGMLASLFIKYLPAHMPSGKGRGGGHWGGPGSGGFGGGFGGGGGFRSGGGGNFGGGGASGRW